MNIKVIGIDPAPSKKSEVYNGTKFLNEEVSTRRNLKNYLDRISGEGNTLICWDAPLTAGNLVDINADGVFTQRIIEKFFMGGDYRTPKGISVLGYSGCPHWTISQHMLGFPQLHPSHKSDFNLIHEKDQILDVSKPLLVEVHPAVAIWMWMGEKLQDWTYKGSKKKPDTLGSMIRLLRDLFEDLPEIGSDDQLDAWVAWKLGDLLVNQPEKVMILGNEQTGSLLLPNNVKMQESFERHRLEKVGKTTE